VNHSLVVTSISEPTPILKALAEGAEKAGWPFYLIGDEKSPHTVLMSEFRSLIEQQALSLQTAHALPLNNYSRKNIGYLLAMRDGAEVIVETDDDNRPLEDFWREHPRVSPVECVDLNGEWFNVLTEFYRLGSAWPRGFPLDLVHADTSPVHAAAKCRSTPILQGLIAGEPDVDAIFRLIADYPKGLNPNLNIALLNSWCPFNSQNTTWFREAFPLMYIPSFCKNAYRMDDIWRSFIAQRIAFENGWGILWGGVTVVQERNLHDLMKDFEQEIPGYLYNRKIVEMLKGLPIAPGTDAKTLLRNMDLCYLAMIEAGYIESRELGVLQAWYDDVISLEL
jgi:hypothetical protein